MVASVERLSSLSVGTINKKTTAPVEASAVVKTEKGIVGYPKCSYQSGV